MSLDQKVNYHDELNRLIDNSELLHFEDIQYLSVLMEHNDANAIPDQINLLKLLYQRQLKSLYKFVDLSNLSISQLDDLNNVYKRDLKIRKVIMMYHYPSLINEVSKLKKELTIIGKPKQFSIIVDIQDSNTDLGIQIQELLNCNQVVKVNLQPGVEYTLNHRIIIPSYHSLEIFGIGMRNASPDSYKAKILINSKTTYPQRREALRISVGDFSNLHIHGVHIIESIDDPKPITQQSPFSGIISCHQNSNIIVEQSKLELTEEYFINAPYYEYCNCFLGYLWVSNISQISERIVSLCDTYTGGNYSSSTMVVRLFKCVFETPRILIPKRTRITYSAVADPKLIQD